MINCFYQLTNKEKFITNQKEHKSEWQANNDGFTFGNVPVQHAKKVTEYKPVYKKTPLTVVKIIKWVVFFAVLEVARILLIG